MKSQTRKYATLVALVLTAWFALSLAASAAQVFHSTAFHQPLPLGLAVLTPLALFSLWFAVSPGFRRFLFSLNPRTLSLLHTWRVGGLTFVVLYVFHILPGVFALPAGWGDFAIGLTAPLVALNLATPDHRRSFMVWQLLGILDLVVAVTVGVLASAPVGVLARGLTTEAMTVLPLSMIPTFAVPLLIILHVICIAQAARWRQPSQLEAGRAQLSVA